MKNKFLICFLFFTVLILGACSVDNDADENSTKDETNNNTNNDLEYTKHGQDPNATPGATFGFTHFDLKVDFTSPDDQLKVLYRNKMNATDVEYSNGATGEQRKGSEAFALIQPMLENVSIDENTSEDEVIQKIIKAFDINNDYTSIDATFTFLNGDKKEYNQMR
ncbi:MAG: YusW family protein [Paenisporosarcina sp.]